MLKRVLHLNMYAVAAQGAVLLTGVLFSIILTRMLSVSDYGLVTSFVSFVVFITLLSDIGLRTTATKYAGAAFFSKDGKLWTYITRLAALRLGIIAFIGIGIFAFSGWLAEAILHSAQYAFVFQLTAGGAIAYAAMHFFEGLVSAANRYDYTFAGSAIVNVSRLVLPIIFIVFIAPVAGWAILGIALAYMLGALAYIYFFRKIYGFAPTWKGELGKPVVNYALFAGIIAVSSAFFTNFDTVLLNALMAPASVGLYKAAQMVLIGVISLAPISYPVIFTFFNELEVGGKRGEQQETYKHAVKYGLAFFIPISVMMFVLAPEIIGFFYTTAYASSAGALQAFALLPAFYFLFNVNMGTMLAREEIRTAAALYVLAGIVSILLNILLIPQFGFVGSALAYALAYTVPALVSIPLLAGRMKLWFSLGGLSKPVLISAAAAAMAVVTKQALAPSQLVLLILFPATCAALYIASMDSTDRRVFGAIASFFRGR